MIKPQLFRCNRSFSTFFSSLRSCSCASCGFSFNLPSSSCTGTSHLSRKRSRLRHPTERWGKMIRGFLNIRKEKRRRMMMMMRESHWWCPRSWAALTAQWPPARPRTTRLLRPTQHTITFLRSVLRCQQTPPAPLRTSAYPEVKNESTQMFTLSRFVVFFFLQPECLEICCVDAFHFYFLCFHHEIDHYHSRLGLQRPWDWRMFLILLSVVSVSDPSAGRVPSPPCASDSHFGSLEFLREEVVVLLAAQFIILFSQTALEVQWHTHTQTHPLICTFYVLR